MTDVGDHLIPITTPAKRKVLAMAGFDRSTIFGFDPLNLDVLYGIHREKSAIIGFAFHYACYSTETRVVQSLQVMELNKEFCWKYATRPLAKYYNPSASDLAKDMCGLEKNSSDNHLGQTH